MLKLKCAKHPRYAGKESPRASCACCVTIYEMRMKALANHVTIIEPLPHHEPMPELKENHWGAL